MVDFGNDDGKSVSEEDDEIFFLPDPELNKTTIVLPPVNLCSPSSSCDVNLPKSSAFVDRMHFVESSRLRSLTLGVWVHPIHKQI